MAASELDSRFGDFAASLLSGCGDGDSSGARERCVRDDGTGENVALVIVAPTEARTLTIADVLRKDERFSQFKKLAEQANTLVRRSFLETWARPKDRLGNKPWLTVFAPTDTAFAVLDSDIATAWEEGRLDNIARYTWLGHSVHRPYPSTHFKEGLQNNWQPTGLGRWKKTPGRVVTDEVLDAAD